MVPKSAVNVNIWYHSANICYHSSARICYHSGNICYYSAKFVTTVQTFVITVQKSVITVQKSVITICYHPWAFYCSEVGSHFLMGCSYIFNRLLGLIKTFSYKQMYSKMDKNYVHVYSW